MHVQLQQPVPQNPLEPQGNLEPKHKSFFTSCLKGDIRAVRKYVETDKENPYVLDAWGRSGLCFAIYGEDRMIVDYLLQVAPYIEKIPTTQNTFPKTIAMFAGDPLMISLFLNAIPEANFEKSCERLVSDLPSNNLIIPPVLQEQKEVLEKIFNSDDSVRIRERYKAVRDIQRCYESISFSKDMIESLSPVSLTGLHCVIRVKNPFA
jgi:hypothetical protein